MGTETLAQGPADNFVVERETEPGAVSCSHDESGTGAMGGAHYSEEDEFLLEQLRLVAEVLGATLGSHTEVVLHDLRHPEESIIHITNGHLSGRRVGGPVIGGPQPMNSAFFRALQTPQLKSNAFVNYRTEARGQQRSFRSSSIIFRNRAGRPIAGLCINIDLTPFEHIYRLSREMLFVDGVVDEGGRAVQAEESTQDIDSFVQQIIRDALLRIGKPVEQLDRTDKIEAVRLMNDRGLFLIKGVVARVAELLGVSKYTLYNYIDQVR